MAFQKEKIRQNCKSSTENLVLRQFIYTFAYGVLVSREITANGADKGKGILAMARHEGFDPSRTIAFGDGGNDTSMILQAGIGIAMGNAIDELKCQADDLFPRPFCRPSCGGVN